MCVCVLHSDKNLFDEFLYSFNTSSCIYVCMCVCVCVYIYIIYIYI